MSGAPAFTVPMGVYPPSTPVTLDEFRTQVKIGPNVPFGVSFLGHIFSDVTAQKEPLSEQHLQKKERCCTENTPCSSPYIRTMISEEALIGMAYAYEQRALIGNAVKPLVQPKTELRDIVWNGSGLSSELEL